MDDPLLLLNAMIEGCLRPCPSCEGVGSIVSYTLFSRLPDPPAEITDAPALMATWAKGIKISDYIRTHEATGTHPCYGGCNGHGKVMTTEGRALMERLARLLVPFLDNAVEPAPHDHDEYVDRYRAAEIMGGDL